MKLLDLFKKKVFPAQTPVASSVFKNDIDTRYAITDEGLEALVRGQLHAEPGDRPGKFFIYYDSLVYDATAHKFYFCWQGVSVMELAVPLITEGNTLTIQGLQGKMPMEMR